MRVFSVPAQYAPFLEAEIARACAEVRRDIERRGDDYEPIQRLATVPDRLMDVTTDGTLTILVGANTSSTTIPAHAVLDVFRTIAAAGATQ